MNILILILIFIIQFTNGQHKMFMGQDYQPKVYELSNPINAPTESYFLHGDQTCVNLIKAEYRSCAEKFVELYHWQTHFSYCCYFHSIYYECLDKIIKKNCEKNAYRDFKLDQFFAAIKFDLITDDCADMNNLNSCTPKKINKRKKKSIFLSLIN